MNSDLCIFLKFMQVESIKQISNIISTFLK